MPTKHNILLILVDQERFPLNFPDEVSLPNHAELQKRDITFTNFQIGTAPCTPSRSVIYTDRTTYPSHGRVRHRKHGLATPLRHRHSHDWEHAP